MRLALQGRSLTERVALALGLVPRAAGEAWGGAALSAALASAANLGAFRTLAHGPKTAEEVAAELGLEPAPTALLLDYLVSAGHLRRRANRYAIARRSRRWLDPSSDRSLLEFVAGAADYGPWWSRLADIVRSGKSIDHHERDADDPHWRGYIRGQHELARLSAPIVARRLRLPPGATSVLDIGGGHGRYSVELCRRHPGLDAVVLDLPGSVRVGREIVAEQGMSDRVRHVVGDALTADLGGPYGLVLCFNVFHHLPPDGIVTVLSRARRALIPGGSVAVLDGFAGRRTTGQGAMLGLFTYVSSGARLYTRSDLAGWLRQSGFDSPRRVSIRPIPGLALYQASVRADR